MNLSQRTLNEWLSHLETLHPHTIALGLERISQVAVTLDLFRWHCPVITVAGTNGKGSCVALLDAILTAAGYRVGCYSSPHLLDYKERISLAGQMVSESRLCAAFAQIESARATTLLTYFEFSTLAALLLFKQAAVDAIVLEVGMGGRLDAVNSVAADIAVISTVALDHQQWLGETREQIAAEKAGIMRPNKPCICGDFDVPATIVAKAHILKLPLYCQAQDFGFQYNTHQPKAQIWSWWNRTQCWEQLPVPRIALQNAACVLQAIALLQPYLSTPLAAIHQGLRRAFLPGRFQTLPGPITTLLDVAHNPAAGRWLAEQLRSLPRPGRTLAVVGMLADKAITHTLEPLVALVDAWYLGSLNVKRGAQSELLKSYLQPLVSAKALHTSPTVAMAYHLALQHARQKDILLVTGSFYTVAEVMRLTL